MKLQNQDLNKLALFGAVFLLLGIWGVYTPPVAYAAPQGNFLQKLLGAPSFKKSYIEGLKPGARLSYNLVSQSGLSREGHSISDANGRAIIPALDDVTEESGTTFLSIVVDDALDVLLHIEPLTKSVSITGRSNWALTPLVISAGVGRIDTRSDWSGQFEMLQVLSFDDVAQRKGFQLAFFDPGHQRDATLGKTPLVKVQFGGLGGLKGGEPDKIKETYVQAFEDMTTQLSASMMQQMLALGTIFDAKDQLEAQRDLQVLQAKAHKDYHPSEGMCRIGTAVRSLAATEQNGRFNKLALSQILMQRMVNVQNSASGNGFADDIRGRLGQFREVYCDPRDNNGALVTEQDGVYSGMCAHTNGQKAGGDSERYNKDIDYSRTLAGVETVDVDFAGYGAESAEANKKASPDEEDVLALGKNLYWFETFDSKAKNTETNANARQIAAMHAAAQNSYTNIVGQKSAAPDDFGGKSGWAHMKALMHDFGLNSAEIDEYIGEKPSYYAQMGILTNKMYQSPQFYTNLYDKPANVSRIRASMEAFDLMQARDQYDSAMRREILIGLLVEQALLKHQKSVSDDLVQYSASN